LLKSSLAGCAPTPPCWVPLGFLVTANSKPKTRSLSYSTLWDIYVVLVDSCIRSTDKTAVRLEKLPDRVRTRA
ncbi:hypothetical protein COCVIDRAFT_110576, partial [Bipolaris victoriae FI3]